MPRPRMTQKEFAAWQAFKESDYVVEQLSELKKQCDKEGIPIKDVRSYWHKSEHFSIFAKPKENPLNDILERFDDLVDHYANGKKRTIPEGKIEANRALKVTTTDDHVGLEPNPKGKSLFQYEYNADVYRRSMDEVYQSIMKEFKTYGRFDFLLLDNLGDQEDGWQGKTTRGGHDLPQNMTVDEVFDVVVDTKVNMIIELAESGVAEKIIARKCVNDNHSGDFGHLVNKAVAKIINMIYDEEFVEVETLTRFMEHRFYGDHCWILTHGKDEEHMRSGLPLHLNNKTVNYINDYIDFYDLTSKAKFIHVDKGDLHRIGYDKVKRFDYRNYMSFCPPSGWQQTNFGDGYSGYSVQVVPKFDNEIAHTDYFLNYEKSK